MPPGPTRNCLTSPLSSLKALEGIGPSSIQSHRSAFQGLRSTPPPVAPTAPQITPQQPKISCDPQTPTSLCNGQIPTMPSLAL